MKRQIRILMLALAGLALASPVIAQPERNSLEGVWSFTVDPDPVGLPTYSNLRSFSRDGVAIVVDGSTNPAFGTASPAVGVWERTGGHEFRFVAYAVLTINGVQSGRQILSAVLMLDPSGNTLSGIGKTTILDMTGKTLFSGTAKITGQRLPLITED